jgi:hypothetical protein
MGWSDEAAEASYRRRGQMTIDRAAIFEQFYGEMKKARERILTTADGEVGWLLKFIQTDLEALTPSEWMVLAFEVASFVDDVANRHGEEIATEGGWSVQSIPGERFRGTIPSRAEAKEVQTMVLRSLQNLWKRQWLPSRSLNSRSLSRCRARTTNAKGVCLLPQSEK